MMTTDIETVLKWRGLRLKSVDGTGKVILPSSQNSHQIPAYLRLLAHFSFRLLLQDILKYGPEFTDDSLTHYAAKNRVRFLLDFLEQCKILSREGEGKYRLLPEGITSFGPTLQWYVAEILQRDFAASCLCNAQIAGLPAGGDYDVLAALGPHLLFIETKASPPKNIHQPSADAFVRRKQAIGADLAIFLVDTHLRMEDKINKMVKWALDKEEGNSVESHQPVRIDRGIFRAVQSIYIMNSKPKIHQNLRTIIRHYFRVK